MISIDLPLEDYFKTRSFGKDVVSIQELKGYLAEQIPGAFQIASRAMSITERELYDLLIEKRLTVSEFFPKFIAQLKIEGI